MCKKGDILCSDTQVGILFRAVYGSLSMGAWSSGYLANRKLRVAMELLAIFSVDITEKLEKLGHCDMDCNSLEKVLDETEKAVDRIEGLKLDAKLENVGIKDVE